MLSSQIRSLFVVKFLWNPSCITSKLCFIYIKKQRTSRTISQRLSSRDKKTTPEVVCSLLHLIVVFVLFISVSRLGGVKDRFRPRNQTVSDEDDSSGGSIPSFLSSPSLHSFSVFLHPFSSRVISMFRHFALLVSLGEMTELEPQQNFLFRAPQEEKIASATCIDFWMYKRTLKANSLPIFGKN